MFFKCRLRGVWTTLTGPCVFSRWSGIVPMLGEMMLIYGPRGRPYAFTSPIQIFNDSFQQS
uniref:Uncharacterized protein n=1 Tax=Anguilla anguilla TaxID=7936 RepID=A0A0E9QJ75_ANGAN